MSSPHSTATHTSDQPAPISNGNGRPSDTEQQSAVPAEIAATLPGRIKVIKRNNKMVPYDDSKIAIAITKAFLDEENAAAAPSSDRIREQTKAMTTQVTETFKRRMPSGGSLHIEEIQDQVELELMRSGHHRVARSYVLYRETRRIKREEQQTEAAPARDVPLITVDGQQQSLDMEKLHERIRHGCSDFAHTDPELILKNTLRSLYEGIPIGEIHSLLIMNARSLMETESDYSFVAARFLLQQLDEEVAKFFALSELPADRDQLYAMLLPRYIEVGVERKLLSPELADATRFDLQQLSAAIVAEQDHLFRYLGLQTLYDRYLTHSEGQRIELPQLLFMRVAMGLALREDNPTARAIEFYRVLSNFDYMCSTPTLFNAGTVSPQLSSCYLSTVTDSLDGIFSAIRNNAMLSKWAGGLGNDWTPVRGLGSHIEGTNGKSQGIVPFLKVANDTTVAVNQGGKRKGALCSYLETWHLDIEEFLELRKNTGDDRRRTHDMHTANWVPDLFMKRVSEDGEWTLFSPHEVPELHEAYGQEFERLYTDFESKAANGELRQSKKIPARKLWRQMINMLFETGHPWITFKDACNIRSPQHHDGRVHSSNLCTEITLNTSEDEIAVCNLGSVNLAQHVTEEGLDYDKLRSTVTTAVRMLDNVIDINYYAVKEAENSNLRHRPIGLGLMGFQDALYKMHIPYNSEEAVRFADLSMEAISYFAIENSVALATQRGSYASYEGSLWSRGILPIDSIELLRQHRGEEYLQMDQSSTMDWTSLREKVLANGVRNSNMMAIAPTATISNITGVTQSIEAPYANIYTKSNLSGEFTVVNPYLAEELKKRDLWDSVMINDIKHFDGSVQKIQRVPEELKALYTTAFEIHPYYVIEAASRRQKWIDQSQSLNIHIPHSDGKQIALIYRMAWEKGLKTTYYMRTLGATQTEKSTIDRNQLNAVPTASNSSDAAAAACSIENGEDCEACQ